MSKRVHKPSADPLAYFIHGQRFYACDLVLMHPDISQETKDFTTIGAAAMSAFASELFLKCLAALETGRVSRTHDLRILFNNRRPKRERELNENGMRFRQVRSTSLMSLSP
jgi:hypothetical protein